MRKDIRMIDIANQLNISVVTVSNALNDREGVSIELRELETFFEQRLLKMTKEDNTKFLEDKIVKSWYFSNGPYVYKLKK